MAATNHERVGRAMELLREGLVPFVVWELKEKYGKNWIATVRQGWRGERTLPEGESSHLDVALVLDLILEQWDPVFTQALGKAEESFAIELRDARDKWAHQELFSSDDTYRVLDTSARLLTAVSAPQSAELERMKAELLRVRYDEQIRGERRKVTGTAIESAAAGTLKAWRDVVMPHRDVATGRYQQAEFAADLWQVHIGEGADEYRDPAEFFRRTFVTDSLRLLMVGALRRIAGEGGDPVVQLQTNFGGGKTHSMLALYHLFSGADAGSLAGVEEVLNDADVGTLPAVNRVVLVGNKISPGNPVTKPDGTVVRTLWGELAWQLGGKGAFARIAADDEHATNPGDVLREMLTEHGPCLILIDEWVAYARQLHDRGMARGDDSDGTRTLAGGDFETQFTFAQTLTEAVKAAPNCVVVISLPASDTGNVSPHASADEAEVGGQRGKEALERLRNVIGRVEASWRPASAEEGFELVRRRLFEPLFQPEQYRDRDVVARAFAELYQGAHHEFPPECRDADYEKRMRAAYPIHPEVFDRLYSDWSTLLTFQRTRGVLRLMAAVIHSLWEKGDRNPLILPANIPIDDPRVQFELTRYLPENWVPVIDKDVDGPHSLPLRTDNEVTSLGKFAACRRVARTIYMGSAPTAGAAHKGLEDRRVRLGCTMPGEPPTVFNDALRRLSATSTFLYQDGSRYWYSTQPTVTKMAEDRAELLARSPDRVRLELEVRLRKDLRETGDFSRIHAMPDSGQDVPDDTDARLVVLSVDYPYSREPGSPADTFSRTILESRGTAPRLFRNTLVFIAADRTRLAELDEVTRLFLAWQSIVAEHVALNLNPHQLKQAETQRDAADSAVNARIPETYQWVLVPVQSSPTSSVEWQALRLTGTDALAVRASRKLRADELLLTSLGPSRLRIDLDRVPLWRGDDHSDVSVRQLIEDFAKYLYLPRLRNQDILLGAVSAGVGLMTWEQDAFAFADSYDEATGRYRALRAGQLVAPEATAAGLLVRADVARRQIDGENTDVVVDAGDSGDGTREGGNHDPVVPPHHIPDNPTRYYGRVEIKDPVRAGREAARIADEVIAHLAGLTGSTVRISLEIDADVPEGVPENVVRIVTENGRALEFTTQGFEAE